MISSKISNVLHYLNSLELRVKDKNSKILVTGDVNAGKSSLINALIRQDIMPTDQQPCTSVFCEILPVSKNAFKEEIHAIKNVQTYHSDDPSTFDLISAEKMKDIVADEHSPYVWLKLYIQVNFSFLDDEEIILKGQEKEEGASNDSLEGPLEISLIDSPGLNHDFLQTMNLFAQQEDIDVIIFLVNAANHLTLSASEFLRSATKEKDYIFVVVNRFDDIKNQDKCRRVVLQQISQVLPKTFEASNELVHFVSAREYSSAISKEGEYPDTNLYYRAFVDLKRALRSYIIEKRPITKLLPAKTYLLNLLHDCLFLSIHNQTTGRAAISELEFENDRKNPVLEQLEKCKSDITLKLDQIVEDVSNDILNHSVKVLGEFALTFEDTLLFPEWPGCFGYFKYFDSLSKQINASSLACLQVAVEHAKISVQQALNNMMFFTDKTIPQGVDWKSITLQAYLAQDCIDINFSKIHSSHFPLAVSWSC